MKPSSIRTMQAGNQGFTLLELLIVIVIIGIMAGTAMLSAPAFMNFRDFGGETERIRVLLEMLRDEAAIQGYDFGFSEDDRSYGFYRFNEISGDWQEWSEKPFRAYEMPEGLHLNLISENKPKEDDKKRTTPQIIFYTDGFVSPFKLTIHHSSGEKRALTGKGYAPLYWEEQDNP